MPSSGEDRPKTARRLDPLGLRALAHPLRVELLSLLRAHGPATITMLADRLGQRSGTVDWHMKTLAKHGFVREDPGRGVGRERFWAIAQERIDLHPGDFADEPGGADQVRAYAESVLGTGLRRAAEWLRADWAPEWADAATVSDWSLALTPAQLGDLVNELRAVVERHKAAADSSDGRRVFVQLQAFPEVISDE